MVKEVMVMNTLGKRLRTARKKSGLTQVELEQLSGVSQQLISRIENGTIESTTEIFNLSKALKISPDWLATGVGAIDDVSEVSITKEEIEFVKLLRRLTSEQKNNTIEGVKALKQHNDLVLKEFNSRHSAA